MYKRQIEDSEGWFIARKGNNLAGGLYGFKVEGLSLARDKDKVGNLGGGECCIRGFCRGIDDHEVYAPLSLIHI